MNKSRIGLMIFALVCVSGLWQLSKTGTEGTAVPSAIPAAPSSPAMPVEVAERAGSEAKVWQSTEPMGPSLGITEAKPLLAGSIRSGLKSSNYRQYIQQVLAVPSASGLRVGLELSSVCSVIQQTKRQAHSTKIQMAPDLEAELQRRTSACEQGGGPDVQQFRALAAAKKRFFDSADEFLATRPLKGTQEELAKLYHLGDVGGMAGWGLASTPEHLILIVGEEEAFIQKASRAHIYAAWQAAICERFTCDDFNARIVRCQDEASCKMSLQDIFKEGSGLDDAAWQQVLEAARRRVKALLPA